MKTNNEHQKNSTEVKEFYNNYIPRQTKVNVNLRHLIIYDELLKFGLKKTSNVLEVGCGIGTVTSLLVKKVVNGEIYGTDISDQSIELCKKKFQKNNNLSFEATDMSKPLLTGLKFDFIIFADVLEHIPQNQWVVIFKNLSSNFKNSTKFLINYPSPYLNKFYRKHSAEKLQIIDQELYFNDFLKIITQNNLSLIEWRPHSIFMDECDYILCKLSCNPLQVDKFNGKHWTKISFRKQLLKLKHLLKL